MPDRFDEAIDRAVREMLDVEPRADLRARVIAHIDGGRVEGGSRTAPALWASALAAAALLLLAIFIARRAEPVPQAPVVATAPDQPLAPVAPPQPSAAQMPPRHVTMPVVRRTPAAPVGARAGTVVAASFAGEDHSTTAIEPLTVMTPIAVAPVTQDRIAPAEIAVRPLNTISEIQIAPLTPPGRR
jgi:hypothetical protein